MGGGEISHPSEVPCKHAATKETPNPFAYNLTVHCSRLLVVQIRSLLSLFTAPLALPP